MQKLELIIQNSRYHIGTHPSYSPGRWGINTKDKVIYSNPFQDPYYWRDVMMEAVIQYGTQKEAEDFKRRYFETTSP